MQLLIPGDTVSVVVGGINSTLTGCPYLLPVNAMTNQRLITSLLRQRPPTSRTHFHYLLGSVSMVWYTRV